MADLRELPAPTSPTRDKIIERLEHLLVMAKEGRLDGLIVAGMGRAIDKTRVTIDFFEAEDFGNAMELVGLLHSRGSKIYDEYDVVTNPI